MTKKKQNIAGETQDYSTVGLVYTDLVNYNYGMSIVVVLPDGSRHPIEYINAVGNLAPMECEIHIKKPAWAQ